MQAQSHVVERYQTLGGQDVAGTRDSLAGIAPYPENDAWGRNTVPQGAAVAQVAELQKTNWVAD